LAASSEAHRIRLAAGSAWIDSGGLVFTSRWGGPLYPDTVTALMSKLIREHNKSVSVPAEALPHARLHDLRHLHATTLQVSGVASGASFGGSRECRGPGLRGQRVAGGDGLWAGRHAA
jgi:integrase